MGELRQFHPSLKILQIKELSKGDFLIIGRNNSSKWIQNMAAPAKNVKVSLPKAFQTNKVQRKVLP